MSEGQQQLRGGVAWRTPAGCFFAFACVLWTSGERKTRRKSPIVSSVDDTKEARSIIHIKKIGRSRTIFATATRDAPIPIEFSFFRSGSCKKKSPIVSRLLHTHTHTQRTNVKYLFYHSLLCFDVLSQIRFLANGCVVIMEKWLFCKCWLASVLLTGCCVRLLALKRTQSRPEVLLFGRIPM